jgi:hypothetical protein
MRGLFDSVITQIKSLVGQQVQEAKEKKNADIDVLNTPKIVKTSPKRY